ncbi:nicotinate-nucleotide adenylyltransferase [Marinobacter sp. X15-166B]|uniref:nicotinate-nucleotide adenylyltransferase n=1 Tax=Marinobacter sp. X15-166B TaxID=1897620 RepID=UPI00085C2448|nr:nicotinate-nucleotide adenylyltransferase [Marinobacter sp. X15-166B]OEY66727.1 nicotinic acid mononucleotide adenylyltransferase [Marinobacter sp. X15-166B]
MRVVYGGTFDPIHHGHLRLAIELRERLGVPAVSLVPSHIPPHRGAPGATSADRLALLHRAVADEPGLVVDDRELSRGGASYTADTLRQLRRELGAQEPLVMVLGSDAFAGFESWRDWQAIAGLAHVVVIPRPGGELEPQSVPARLLETSPARTLDALWAAPAGGFIWLELPLLDISATAIREHLQQGRSPRYLLPDAVLAEIRERGLYGVHPACPRNTN